MEKIIILVMLCISIQLYSQEFYEDGSMKLTQISTDKNYGYEANHETAIKVGSIANERPFLEALLGPNGETLKYFRTKSCCKFKSNTPTSDYGFLDEYAIYYEGLKEAKIIYLNAYEFETPKCPNGFTFKTIDQIEKPIVFPEDSILQINICNKKNIYTVDKEFLLKEKIGDLPTADKKPKYKGGINDLKEYFAKQPLTDNKAKGIVFRVSIGFLVNCNGEAGNFQILTKGKGELETLANQVLEKVNKMPQGWLPAKKKGKVVDCYQVLNFMIEDGKLDNVLYR